MARRQRKTELGAPRTVVPPRPTTRGSPLPRPDLRSARAVPRPAIRAMRRHGLRVARRPRIARSSQCVRARRFPRGEPYTASPSTVAFLCHPAITKVLHPDIRRRWLPTRPRGRYPDLEPRRSTPMRRPAPPRLHDSTDPGRDERSIPTPRAPGSPDTAFEFGGSSQRLQRFPVARNGPPPKHATAVHRTTRIRRFPRQWKQHDVARAPAARRDRPLPSRSAHIRDEATPAPLQPDRIWRSPARLPKAVAPTSMPRDSRPDSSLRPTGVGDVAGRRCRHDHRNAAAPELGTHPSTLPRDPHPRWALRPRGAEEQPRRAPAVCRDRDGRYVPWPPSPASRNGRPIQIGSRRGAQPAERTAVARRRPSHPGGSRHLAATSLVGPRQQSPRARRKAAREGHLHRRHAHLARAG